MPRVRAVEGEPKSGPVVDVALVEGAARLATFGPESGVWADDFDDGAAYRLGAGQVFIRLVPPPGFPAERAERVREALARSGASVRLDGGPRLRGVAGEAVDEAPPPDARPHLRVREVVGALVDASPSPDRDALRAAVDLHLAAEGL